MKNSILIFLTAATLNFLFSCTTPLKVTEGIPSLTNDEYQTLVQKKSERLEVYNGLYNQMTVSATRMDAEMSQAYLSHSARLSQWTVVKYQDEKNKIVSKGAESTEYFISLYTPERKHNDLSSSKSIWKILLDVNGQRYEGKAVKIKSQLTEVEAMYPAHNRWSTPYVISFPVASALTDGKPSVLTLTGPVTAAQLTFK